MAGCGGDHGSTKDGPHVTVRLQYHFFLLPVPCCPMDCQGHKHTVSFN